MLKTKANGKVIVDGIEFIYMIKDLNCLGTIRVIIGNDTTKKYINRYFLYLNSIIPKTIENIIREVKLFQIGV